jgi:hypothetical protein
MESTRFQAALRHMWVRPLAEARGYSRGHDAESICRKPAAE